MASPPARLLPQSRHATPYAMFGPLSLMQVRHQREPLRLKRQAPVLVVGAQPPASVPLPQR